MTADIIAYFKKGRKIFFSYLLTILTPLFHSYIGWFIYYYYLTNIWHFINSSCQMTKFQFLEISATPHFIDFSFDHLLYAVLNILQHPDPEFLIHCCIIAFSVGWCWLLHYFCTQALANSQHVILLWVLFSAVIVYCVTCVIPKYWVCTHSTLSVLWVYCEVLCL